MTLPLLIEIPKEPQAGPRGNHLTEALHLLEEGANVTNRLSHLKPPPQKGGTSQRKQSSQHPTYLGLSPVQHFHSEGDFFEPLFLHLLKQDPNSYLTGVVGGGPPVQMSCCVWQRSIKKGRTQGPS